MLIDENKSVSIPMLYRVLLVKLLTKLVKEETFVFQSLFVHLSGSTASLQSVAEKLKRLPAEVCQGHWRSTRGPIQWFDDTLSRRPESDRWKRVSD